jgi:hypothetical protein
MRRLLGIAFLFLMTFAAPVFAQRSVVFPQIASGGGWTSELFFANQGIPQVSGITVNFYDGAGNPLSVESNLGTGSSYTFDLSAGATQVIRITPGGTATQDGYVVATYPSYDSPVRATLVYRYQQGATVQAAVGVPQQEQGDHFSFPAEVNSSQGIATAVAFINPAAFSSNPETLVVNLIASDGTIQATATVPMNSGQHLAGYLNQPWLFPGLDNFTGSISVSSPFGVGVLALRQDGQAFGGISTDGGPILGPFAWSGTPIPEVEPNDTAQDAQKISGSTIINGTIDPAGDIDAFQFTGKAGDIISVICEAEVIGSSLDSVLQIYDSTGTIIAENDQNGLAPEGYPENDSFIQMVLPADGTYYIVVEDAFGNGGADYTYTLYVKLP